MSLSAFALALALSPSAFAASASAPPASGLLREGLLPPAPAAPSGVESDEGRLLALTNSPDAEVRRAAAHDLKYYLVDAPVKSRLMALAAEGGAETFTVRKEAVKSLAWGTQDADVLSLVRSLARSSRDEGIRSIAMKALYFSASSDDGVRRFVLDAAENDRSRAARAGALWALWDCAKLDDDVRDGLLRVARGSSDAALRAEAVKSLFTDMFDPLTEAAVLALAGDAALPLELRRTAVLALSAASQDSDARDFLEREASADAEAPELKAAAAKALKEAGSAELLEYFHVGWRVLPGYPYQDPLERE